MASGLEDPDAAKGDRLDRRDAMDFKICGSPHPIRLPNGCGPACALLKNLQRTGV
jgi:hypothetical protein